MSGVKLADLLRETASVDVHVGGAVLEVRYYALWQREFSEEDWARFRTMPLRDQMKILLPKMLTNWDLIDGDGSGIPITAEAFDQHDLPTDLLWAIQQACANGGVSGKARSNSSRVT